jgi:outer membrane protein assembly factor BamA
VTARIALMALVALVCPCAAFGQADERITEIRIHGNYATADADVLALSGLRVGEPATDARLQEALQKLRASHRFEGVDVRRRYLSIDDPSAILVMIVVDEHPAVTPDHPVPGKLRRLGFATMWLPILSYADGYGFTYGARFAFVDPLGPHTRISVPLSWGGERRAAMDVERTFGAGALVSRVSGSLAIYQRENPHYETPDLRHEARGRVEKLVTPWLRIGANARTAQVEFADTTEMHTAGGADVLIDTRLDPSFPRNALRSTIGWERIDFETGAAGRFYGDVRGYVGLFGSNVLALRTQFSRVDAALPPSEQALLGGSASLRGYDTGYRAGDNMAAVSAEVRVPLVSPIRIGRFGVKGFIDAGTVWPDGARLSDQRFDHGIGGGVYMGVAVLMLDLDVAWPESGGPKVHFGMGVTF